ncbi:hypothetical protein BDN72DRAFT_837855 [Pluteus cervinus]|uniref:Uncharacterized protein n=1 Tax=Pluteus cervinus TaxID=181527 RepID=A0ACD3AZT5_9AGAR|nr:hypothetical protein BDN72DRAFT_837855 [Pluteus cervinus]
MSSIVRFNDLNEDILLHIVSFDRERAKTSSALSRTSKHLRDAFFLRVWRDCSWPSSGRLDDPRPLPGHVLPYIQRLTISWPGDSQLWPISEECCNLTVLVMLQMDMRYSAALASACTTLPSLTSLSIQPLTVWQKEMGRLVVPTIGIANLKEFQVFLPHDSRSKCARSSRREASCAAAEASVISTLIVPSQTTLHLLELDGEHLPYLHLRGPFPKLCHIKLCNLEPLLTDGTALLDHLPDAPLLKDLELFLHHLLGEPPVKLASQTKQLAQLFPHLQQIKLYNSSISDMLFQSLPSGITHIEVITTPFPMTSPSLGPGFLRGVLSDDVGICQMQYTMPEMLSWLQRQVYPALSVLKLTINQTAEGPLSKSFANILVGACPQLEQFLIHTSFPHCSNALALLDNFAAGFAQSMTLKSLYIMAEWAEFELEHQAEYWPQFFSDCACRVAQRLPQLREVAFLKVYLLECGYYWYLSDGGEIKGCKTGNLNSAQPFINTDSWKL